MSTITIISAYSRKRELSMYLLCYLIFTIYINIFDNYYLLNTLSLSLSFSYFVIISQVIHYNDLSISLSTNVCIWYNLLIQLKI